MKHLFSISVLVLLATFLPGCFTTNDQQNEIPIEIIEGEVFVRLASWADYNDLVNLTDDMEITINRPLGNGYILDVPKDFEPLWVTQISSAPMIAEAGFNKYGYDYSIEILDPVPVAENDIITLTVNYTGCETNHSFQLEEPGAFSNNMEIWLFKGTEDQDCEMAISEELTFGITRFISLATRLTIEDPYGNEYLLWPSPVEPEAD